MRANRQPRPQCELRPPIFHFIPLHFSRYFFACSSTQARLSLELKRVWLPRLMHCQGKGLNGVWLYHGGASGLAGVPYDTQWVKITYWRIYSIKGCVRKVSLALAYVAPPTPVGAWLMALGLGWCINVESTIKKVIYKN